MVETSTPGTNTDKGRRPRSLQIIFVALAALLMVLGGLLIPPWSLDDFLYAEQRAFPAGASINRVLAVVSLAALLWTVYQFWRRGLAAEETEETDAGEPKTRETPTGFWTSRLGFGLLTAATVFLWRWPLLLHFELNPDEGQSIAAAVTLLHDPRYWISADVGTHGPLIAFSRLIPCLLGMSPDFASGRLVGTGLLIGCLFATVGILRSCFQERTVRLVVTPLTLFIASIKMYDLVAYNAEHLTVFLLMAAAYLGVCALRRAPGLLPTIGAGLLLGCVPWAKLQGVPAAVVLGLMLIGGFLNRRKPRHITLLIAASVVPTVLVLTYVVLAGCRDHFWHQYILQNLAYANGKSYYRSGVNFNLTYTLFTVETTSPFWQNTVLLTALLFIIFCLRYRRMSPPRTVGLLDYPAVSGGISPAPLLLAALLLLLTTVYSVTRLGVVFAHYLVFLIFPLGILSALITGITLDGAVSRRSDYLRPLRPLLAAVSLLYPLFGYGYDLAVLGPEMQSFVCNPPRHARAIEIIKEFLVPGEPLVEWGCEGSYYSRTGALQGIRNTNVSPSIAVNDPMYPYFHQIFLEDFDRSRPPVFLEATGPGHFYWGTPENWDITKFPDVKARVEAGYIHYADVDGAKIYVRKDRWETYRRAHERQGRQGQGAAK